MRDLLLLLALAGTISACSDKPKGYMRSGDGKTYILGSRCAGAGMIQRRGPNGAWLPVESCKVASADHAPICVQPRSDAPAACKREEDLNFVTTWTGKKGQRIEFVVKDEYTRVPSHFTYRCGSSEGEARQRGRQGLNACTLKADGEVELTITGYVQALVFNCSGPVQLSSRGWLKQKERLGMTNRAPQEAPSLTEINSWGQNPWRSLSLMFAGCDELSDAPDEAPVLSQAETLTATFFGAERFNEDLSSWDTGSIKRMDGMFRFASSFDQDIGGWDTRNVESMDSMFRGASAFNQNIGRWDTGKVINMQQMFAEARRFDQDIEGWDTRSVLTMESMFDGASAFNHPVGIWEVGHVQNMSHMFRGAVHFNQDISRWEMKNVKDRRGMFDGAEAYNKAHKR